MFWLSGFSPRFSQFLPNPLPSQFCVFGPNGFEICVQTTPQTKANNTQTDALVKHCILTLHVLTADCFVWEFVVAFCLPLLRTYSAKAQQHSESIIVQADARNENKSTRNAKEKNLFRVWKFIKNEIELRRILKKKRIKRKTNKTKIIW